MIDPASITEDAVIEQARNDLIFYTRYFDENYQPSETGFHRYLAEKLEAVTRGEIKHLIISTPPQHGKSRLVGVEWPSWLLGRKPRTKIVLGSYAVNRAEHNSLLTRNRVAEPEWRRIFGTGLSDSRIRIGSSVRRIDEWYLENAVGGYKAVGMGGGITGFSADLIIVDDPHSGWEEAHSPTMRDKVWNWFLSDLMTRRSKDAPIVIIMTRWHMDDLVGRLLDPKRSEELRAAGLKLNWEMVRLPAIAEENDLIKRQPGEALFPERHPKQFVIEQMAALGSYLASALYRADPTMKGGNYLDPDKLIIKSPDDVPPTMHWVRYWDLGATEAKEAEQNDPSYTAGIQGGKDKDGNLWLRRCVRGQWAWPKARERIRSMAISEEGCQLGIEAVAGFKTALANLREVLPPNVRLVEYDVDRDKLTRALPWIAMAENSKVFLVAGEWITEFKQEVEAFPAGAHDDQIDAVSGCYKMLFGTGGKPMPVQGINRQIEAIRYRRERSLVG